MSIEVLEQYIQTANLPQINNLLSANKALAYGTTSYGVSPIMLARYYNKVDVINLLLNYIDEFTLFEAAAIGKFDVVAHLVYTHPELINQFSNDGFTPLGLACYFGQAEVARFLVLKGANVNVPSSNGFQVYPIHSAVAANQNEIVRTLIDGGAQVNVKQQVGITPLHSAAKNGNLEVLILLLENGADISIRMEGGKLPADLAREKGFDDIADILSY
jgi:ankyrin repeat protein